MYSISGSCPLSHTAFWDMSPAPQSKVLGPILPLGEERLPRPVIQLGTPAGTQATCAGGGLSAAPSHQPCTVPVAWPALTTRPWHLSLLPRRPLHPVPEVGPPMLTASVAGPTIRPANVAHRHSRSQARGRSLGLRGGGGPGGAPSPLQPESPADKNTRQQVKQPSSDGQRGEVLMCKCTWTQNFS